MRSGCLGGRYTKDRGEANRPEEKLQGGDSMIKLPEGNEVKRWRADRIATGRTIHGREGL